MTASMLRRVTLAGVVALLVGAAPLAQNPNLLKTTASRRSEPVPMPGTRARSSALASCTPSAVAYRRMTAKQWRGIAKRPSKGMRPRSTPWRDVLPRPGRTAEGRTDLSANSKCAKTGPDSVGTSRVDSSRELPLQIGM